MQSQHRSQERVAQPNQEYQAQQIQERSKHIHDKIHNFKKANLEYIVSSDNPSQEEIETLYRNIAAEMQACHMPIIPFEDLTPTSGTRPKNEGITPSLEFIVGKELYLMLAKAILESFSQTEHGYGALNLVMKNCSYLRTLQAPWGPTWLPQQTRYKYVAMLKRHIRTVSFTGNMRYGPQAIAIELLQQAKQHSRYHNIATQYLTRLMLLPPEEPLGMKYEMTHLAGEMNLNRTTEVFNNPTINKAKYNTHSNNKRESKFKYKQEVQCKCCQNFGHNINSQICQIGTQVFHSHQFMNQQPIKARDNAQAYSISNNKTQINNTKAQLTKANNEEVQDHLESMACSLVKQINNTAHNPTPKNYSTDK
jgi:hypothetical protein